MIYRKKIIAGPAIAFLLLASATMPAHAQESTPYESGAISCPAADSVTSDVSSQLAMAALPEADGPVKESGPAKVWSCTGNFTSSPRMPNPPPANWTGTGKCHITCQDDATPADTYTVAPDETWAIGPGKGSAGCAKGSCNAAAIVTTKWLNNPPPTKPNPKPVPAPTPPKVVVNESGPTVTESLTPPVVYESR